MGEAGSISLAPLGGWVLIQSVSLQIAVQNPLVSERMEVAVLYKEYADDDHIYQQKIKVRVTCKEAAGASSVGEKSLRLFCLFN